LTVRTEERQRLGEEAAIRANLYRVAAAFFMSPPTESLLKAVASNPLVPFDVDSGWNIEDLVQEYHDLFQVPTGSYVFPYESCYLGRSKSRPGPLMGKCTVEVQEFYKQAGFEVAPDARELPDHAGVEFGMLQKLAEKEAEAWRAEEEKQARNWQRWQSAFVTRHMAQWIPELCTQIEFKTTQRYFSDFASWIRGFIEGANAGGEDCPRAGAEALPDSQSDAKRKNVGRRSQDAFGSPGPQSEGTRV